MSASVNAGVAVLGCLPGELPSCAASAGPLSSSAVDSAGVSSVSMASAEHGDYGEMFKS